MKVNKYGAGVFTVPDTLNPNECAIQISFAESLGFKGTAMEDIQPQEELYRENDRVFFTDEGLATTLYQRVGSFLPVEIDGW